MPTSMLSPSATSCSWMASVSSLTWTRTIRDSSASTVSQTGSATTVASTLATMTCPGLRQFSTVAMTTESPAMASLRLCPCRPTTRKVTTWAPVSKPQHHQARLEVERNKMPMHRRVSLAGLLWLRLGIPPVRLSHSQNRRLSRAAAR